MATEQDKTLEGLKTAIQMEIDGKQFYLKAGKESSNEAGKKLLESLAAEEDIHRQKFEEIFESIRDKNAWPKTDFKPDGGSNLRTLFSRATEQVGKSIKALDSELDAVQTAVNMEAKTYDFYISQRQSTPYPASRDFYQALASQEREHQLILLDYYEFLKNPAGWFVNTEHPILDGG
ncbi:MAG: ferritin family protein [Chloroflexota bacterium]|nr:ferritin family protein [Chloroflexota bacterium]